MCTVLFRRYTRYASGPNYNVTMKTKDKYPRGVAQAGPLECVVTAFFVSVDDFLLLGLSF